MSSSSRQTQEQLINEQGAMALLAATFNFLRQNKISRKVLVSYARRRCTSRIAKTNARMYRRLLRAYEDMGVVMATWFSHPRFLDKSGSPLPLTAKHGSKSVANLVRISRVQVTRDIAVGLMRRSPSIKSNSDGTFLALRRVFVLPEFELPRAALVVERYFDTLRRNASGRKQQTVLLLERSSHVPRVELRGISPTLRDIKERGAAFMDSVDGDLEGCRLRRSQHKGIGELGVLVFAWTRPNQRDKSQETATPREHH